MNERSLMILGAMVGAAVGAGVGFFVFTERGRQIRAELQPELETVLKEAMRLSQVADDVWSGRPVSAVSATAPAAAWPRRTQ